MYCTQADLEKVLPRRQLIELSCDPPGQSLTQALPDAPEEAVVNDAIRYAGEQIDLYLRNRYQVPLTTVPTVIRDLAVNLAVERLYLRRPVPELPESVRMLAKGTIKTLELIRDGRLTPGSMETRVALPEAGQTRVKSRPATLGGPGGWLEKY